MSVIEKLAGFNLRMTLVVLLVGYLAYSHIQKRQQKLVSWPNPEYPSLCVEISNSYLQAEKAFGDQHGCQELETTLEYKWPLALDLLKRQYDVLPSQKLLAFQAQFLEKAPNLKFMLFGATGYISTDPRNIEAVLSTNFEGENTQSPYFVSPISDS